MFAFSPSVRLWHGGAPRTGFGLPNPSNLLTRRAFPDMAPREKRRGLISAASCRTGGAGAYESGRRTPLAANDADV